jgi:hypothetical protein
MRALTACLTVVLGLGVAAMAACSSTSDSTATGGTGGTSSGGTSAGGTATGGTGGSAVGAAGDNGAAGAAECSFDSDACTACLAGNCAESLGTCAMDNDCGASLSALRPCVCGGSTSPVECETTFIGDGDLQKALADCFDANCKTECEGPTN